MKFIYPINVICFNRPEYLVQLLKSLKGQSIECPSELLFFWVDGYSGSKDEMLGRPDQTKETALQVQEAFPRSNVMVSGENLGIAKNYWRAELNSFETLGVSSAFFLEEDLVLSPHYFELTMKMDTLFSFDKVISHFSPTGDITHTSSAPKEYIEIISMKPYYLRDELQSKILEHFYNKGIILAGTSQDAIKDGLRNHFGRVSVTTLDPWASNIGVLGEHSQEESLHHNRMIAEDLRSFPNNFDPMQNVRLALDGKNKTTSQVYQNYLSHI